MLEFVLYFYDMLGHSNSAHITQQFLVVMKPQLRWFKTLHGVIKNFKFRYLLLKQ